VKRPPHFEIVKSKRNKRQPWFARIVASNGRTLAHSEQYRTRRAAERACAAINPHLQIKVIR
jgi:uncharacterized protein YegP (UPF0339 family)